MLSYQQNLFENVDGSVSGRAVLSRHAPGGSANCCNLAGDDTSDITLLMVIQSLYLETLTKEGHTGENAPAINGYAPNITPITVPETPFSFACRGNNKHN